MPMALFVLSGALMREIAVAVGSTLMILVALPQRLASPSSTVEPPDYVCPLSGSPQIRPGDAVAHSGGRFDSSRDGGRKHGALDLNSTEGAPVLSVRSGVVAVSADGWGPFGTTIVVDHGDGVYTVYAHLSDRAVRENDSVNAGQQIGSVGYTGNAAALRAKGLPPHLHFAMIRATRSGLAGPGQPLRRMRNLDDSWESLGAEFSGPVNPGDYMPSSCWTGSTTTGSER
jgi:murein DD-endopeptidase MepM/ murein hydrolase activator NlpD